MERHRLYENIAIGISFLGILFVIYLLKINASLFRSQYAGVTNEKPSIAQLEQSNNLVKLRRASLPTWENVNQSKNIYSKDVVYTDANSGAEIKFLSGVKVDVGEKSLVVIDDENTEPTIVLKEGKCIAHLHDPQKNLNIEITGIKRKIIADDADVSVATYKDGHSELSVLNGQIDIEDKGVLKRFKKNQFILSNKQGEIESVTNLEDQAPTLLKVRPPTVEVSHPPLKLIFPRHETILDIVREPSSDKSIERKTDEKGRLLHRKGIFFLGYSPYLESYAFNSNIPINTVNGMVVDSFYLSGEYLLSDQFSGNLSYQRSAGSFFGSATTTASPDQGKLNFTEQRGELSVLKKDLLSNSNSHIHWLGLFGYAYKDVFSFNKSSLDTVGLVYNSVHSAMVGFGNRSYLGKNISFEGIVRYSYPFLSSGIELQQNNDLKVTVLFSRPIGERLELELGYEIGYWNYNFTDSSNSLSGNISNTEQTFKLGLGLTF